ncbi:MAG: alpha-glucan family phosphorylase [Pyrinomonadaceae bacterium]|nr:alpha-glucan family phosphorylase [Pyrinomonadaceae bacterium]
MTEVATDISAQPTTAQEQPDFRENFSLNRKLPWALAELDRISMNFYWSWRPDGVALFRDLDPTLWDKCEQNPRLILNQIGNLRMWERANDAAYLERIRAFADDLDAYLEGAGDSPAAARGSDIAYFCAEFGVHNSLPNYSGGLGILAGDHLKSASDLDVPLTAIGLLYRYGYFRQSLRHDGWQEERYSDVFESELALTPVLDDNGERITVCVHIRGREVTAQAWLARVGRVSLYLLDTHLPQNSEVDRLITGHLYGGDTETRIVQEKVLGIGGVRLLRKLGIEPAVYHLNEGHAAFSTLELAHEYLAANLAQTFADAVEAVRPRCVFTTHTPVAAGNDNFAPDLLIECFSEEFINSLKLTKGEFLALGRADLSDDKEFFGMTPLAIRMCRSSNGVSEKHGEVSRELWLKMFPDLADAGAVPITSVTNGVHPATWIAPPFQDIYRRHLGDAWQQTARHPDAWAEYINSLNDGELWSAHQSLKGLLIAFIRNRTRSDDIGDIDTIHEHESTKGLFSPDVLTIGFARRVAAYKRWDLIFSDLERLLRLVDDVGQPVQFVFAGKAHPQDNTAKTILQELMSINHDSNWQRRAVFVEDYDQEIARHLVQGVDVWMNVPRRPMEASGTSGMKAAMNGILNFSVLDGWWIEGYNGENGFAIEGRNAGTLPVSDEEVDAADADSLFAVLENEMIPMYYDRADGGFSPTWVARMKNAIATLTPQFSSDRMLNDYLTRIYDAQ